MTLEAKKEIQEFEKFIEDNFSYSNIGANEDGDYGEDKVNWIWREGIEGKMSKKLREKIIKIIKKKKENYYE